MEIAQGYARLPKRNYAAEKCRFYCFVITLGYLFYTNFLQTFIMKKVHLFSYFVVLCWFLQYISLKFKLIQGVLLILNEVFCWAKEEFWSISKGQKRWERFHRTASFSRSDSAFELEDYFGTSGSAFRGARSIEIGLSQQWRIQKRRVGRCHAKHRPRGGWKRHTPT